ncbi:MAG TPA: thioredoxin domain-containing protein [Gemmataceae bacterium]|nr:thioredoxin domain-containing protein [Gemmataceae bacterium]
MTSTATAMVFLAASVAAADKPTNHLAGESSPYLLQHAHNPVDWYPWGDEAFAKAKKEGKLVFLSIGYSSCHWCHVMERESFENQEIADLLNKDFVCIKVDREERPDIDNVYITALAAMRRPGGWPMTLFLTADGKPFFGGTYFPPEDKNTPDGDVMPGLKTLIKAVKKVRDEQPKDMQDQADEMAKRTTDLLAGQSHGGELIGLDRDLVAGAVDALKEQFDSAYGGFGSAARGFRGTKFPMPPALLLLQHEAARAKANDLGDMVSVTLDHMARGGINDHLGGGFHRYSTERTWTVPHFEKMLYDNAQLLELYAQAYQSTKGAADERVLRQTLRFVEQEMTAPDGGFYSALDADADGKEGRFYVWTDAEIDAALGSKEDSALFKQVYGADGEPNFESQRILVLPKSLAERAKELKTTEAELEARLAPLRQKLLDARAKRFRPFLDTKILTGWNGEMIAGQAAAGMALGDKKPIETAARAAEFLLSRMRSKDGRLLRAYGAAPGQKPTAHIPAYLDDYAYLIHGLLTLHDASGDKRWLDEAKALTDVMIQYHEDKDAGGFFYTANDSEKLFARAKDQYDGAQPCGNSVAARDLVRLWMITGEEKYAKAAQRTMQALAPALKINPAALPALADALALYLDAKAKK